MLVEKRVNRRDVSVTQPVLDGLRAVHRYRLLSVVQFAKASGLKPSHLRDVLRDFERRGLLGSIGNVGLRGGSKSPKLYFLTRAGFDFMLDASGMDAEAVEPFTRANTNTRWSPIMAHRMATIDLLLAVETGIKQLGGYSVIQTFHEYRRVALGNGPKQPETSDFVGVQAVTEDRIVPDAAFVLENFSSGARGLYFVETDCGTERLTRQTPTGYSVVDKFRLYERYLRGGRFSETYRKYGDFTFFTVLVVLPTVERLRNCRNAAADLDPALHEYFRLADFDAAVGNITGPVWLSRDATNSISLSILKQHPNRKETT